MRNKFKAIIAMLLVTFLLTSCYGTFEHRVDTYLVTEYRIIDKVADALDHKNSKKLKKLFSKKVMSEYSDFEQDYNALSEFFTGDIVSVDPSARHGGKEGPIYKRDAYCGAELNITTTDDSYIVFYRYCIADSNNRDNEGLLFLRVIKAEDRDKYFYDIGGWATIKKFPGIFIGNETQDSSEHQDNNDH